MRPLKPIWLLAIHLAWLCRIISFLLEFITTEHDWKFLMSWMFNNGKCSFIIYNWSIFAEPYSEPCLWNIWDGVFREHYYCCQVIECFCKRLYLKCLTGYEYANVWICWFNHKLYLKFSLFSGIPCIPFLYANYKLVITQKPYAVLNIFHACFSYLALIS